MGKEMVSSPRVEDLSVESVVSVLEKWGVGEFTDFVKEKQLDGRTLLEVTEGIVKLWRPKINANKLLTFIQELKLDPEKYIQDMKVDNAVTKTDATTIIERQYQTVTVRKVKEEHITTVNGVEELLKKIVPAKSFLYRNQVKKTDKTQTSYVPMDAGTAKKPKRFFRLSSYEYPHFDLRSRNSKPDFSDRGYYSVKTNNKCYIQKIYKKPEPRPKYRSLTTAEELNDNKYPEDHFYEDLCYNDIEEAAKNKEASPTPVTNVKVKIAELFQSFRLPFFRKQEVVERDETPEVKEKEEHIYENNSNGPGMSMYDSVHVTNPSEDSGNVSNKVKLAVEDYLEPIQTNKDYCDVNYNYRQRDESILGYIMSIFENRFGIRRETNEDNQSDESDSDNQKDAVVTEVRNSSKCPESHRPKTNMAHRPLPIPIENEPYYMNIDRSEAENLLKGQPDGMFVLRPSSQPNHAYTLTVSCANSVHNVGVRRRSDGRLALGFARRGERSYPSAAALLRHHRRRRLLLVTAGGVIGATTLNDTPMYYQTPSNIPVPV